MVNSRPTNGERDLLDHRARSRRLRPGCGGRQQVPGCRRLRPPAAARRWPPRPYGNLVLRPRGSTSFAAGTRPTSSSPRSSRRFRTGPHASKGTARGGVRAEVHFGESPPGDRVPPGAFRRGSVLERSSSQASSRSASPVRANRMIATESFLSAPRTRLGCRVPSPHSMKNGRNRLGGSALDAGKPPGQALAARSGS